MRTDHDPSAMVERALYFRDQCLEWAEQLWHLPEIKRKMEAEAIKWEKFAASVRRDAQMVVDSRMLIAKADQILKGQRPSQTFVRPVPAGQKRTRNQSELGSSPPITGQGIACRRPWLR
jgi:hypothetical protein